jgi:hypothetical protein
MSLKILNINDEQDPYNQGVDYGYKTTHDSNKATNPFFVGIRGGSLNTLCNKEIYSTYTRVFVICMNDNYDNIDELLKVFSPETTLEDFSEMDMKNFSLLEGSINMLQNNNFKKNACLIEGSVLRYLFKNLSMYEYDVTEIVIPMFELTETIARTNVSLYEKPNDMNKVNTVIKLMSKYNKNYNKPVRDEFHDIINNLKESQFWKKQTNCNINMTKFFGRRNFYYKKKQKKCRYIGNTIVKDNINSKLFNSDYFSSLDDINRNVYNDIYTSIKESPGRTFFITQQIDLLMTKERCTELLLSLTDEKEIYYLMNSLLASKDYCHMVINNGKVLDKVNYIIEKHKPLYKTLLGYTWLTFLIEESIMKTKTTKEDRYVFDINTANKLPVFPYIYEDMLQNPYTTLPISKFLMNSLMDTSIGLYCVKNHDGYGVCNLDTFIQRFNVALTGKNNIDIFKGIDWSFFAISGSLVSACIQKKSPILSAFEETHQYIADPNENPNDAQKNKDIAFWKEYIEKYYGDSDIDMMCNDKSMIGFINKVENIVNTIKENLGDVKLGKDLMNLPNFEPNSVTVEPIKSMIIKLTEDFFTVCLDDYNENFNTNYTSNELKKQIDSHEMEEYLHILYVNSKIKANKLVRESDIVITDYLKAYMKLSSIDETNIKITPQWDESNKYESANDCIMKFRVNDYLKEKVDINNNNVVISIEENIKYKIHMTQLDRTIELFRSKSKDFFSLVGRFHLPCVRAFYQGDNVYMTPSCITAMMTGINIDYKYFSGMRNPVEIINKYMTRGYGTLLTRKERISMKTHNKDLPVESKYHMDGKLKHYLNPRKLSDRIYDNVTIVEQNGKYIESKQDLINYYFEKYNYDHTKSTFNMFNITPINTQGNVTPYKSWLPSAYLDSMY